jgi:hypothetical protein
MIADDPLRAILLFCGMGGVIVVVAPFLLWIIGETVLWFHDSFHDSLAMLGNWYVEMWRAASDTWHRIIK